MSSPRESSTARQTLRQPSGIRQWYLRLGVSSLLFLAILLAGAVLVVLVAATRSITVPLVLAVTVALVITPLVNRIEAWGVRRGIAALIGLVLVIGVFAGVVLIVGFALADQGDELRLHIDEAQQEIEEFVANLPIDAGLVSDLRESAENAGPGIRDGVMTRVASAIDTALGFFTGVILGLVFLYYLLKDGAELAQRVLGLFNENDRESVAEAGVYASKATRDYFRSRTVVSLINGVIISLGMVLIGVPGALAIGVVTFVGGYVPYLGGFIAGAFAVLLGISEGGIGLGLIALAIVLFVQFVLENLLEPMVVGEFVDLHPLAVLIVTILGGTFMGFVGLILAVPITMVIAESIRILRRHGYFDDKPETLPDA